MQPINDFVNALNSYLFHPWVVYALLFCGVLFTIWSAFGQYRALTHGVAVTFGKYDDKNDPGAINHFQALSAALSATVGLGNIGGVAVAVALGGPGAILWMWVIGVVGMALKMTEVTQSMLYRNTDDPDNPHGGPMFVVQKGLTGPDKKPIAIGLALAFSVVIIALTSLSGSTTAIIVGALLSLGLVGLAFANHAMLGSLIGGIFVVTLVISAITGGNMFQVWNVGDITKTYFDVPQVVTGIVLAVLVGLTIIGGIKRIGSVAGRIVPFMCFIYILAAAFVLLKNFGTIPSSIALIFKSGLPAFLGGSAPDATGAFLGGTFGYAAMWGVKRALFSSEAGQGSSPIAHSAAKTDEPVREGIVAGLEPFIDTLVVCSLTALVILSTGAYNREAEATYSADGTVSVEFVSEEAAVVSVDSTAAQEEDGWQFKSIAAPDRLPNSAEREANTEEGKPFPEWQAGDEVFAYVDVQPGNRERIVSGKIVGGNGEPLEVEFNPLKPVEGEAAIASVSRRGSLYFGAAPLWSLKTGALPELTDDAKRIRRSPEGTAGWRDDEVVFMITDADVDPNTGRSLRRISGTVNRGAGDVWSVAWRTLASEIPPTLRIGPDGQPDLGIYGDYAGASMTAYAFDRASPGLGKVVVTIAAWLFALSTMISWSYYGEQGIYFLFGGLGSSGTKTAVLLYKLIYCLLIFFTGVAAMPIMTNAAGVKVAIIATDGELDMWTTLGLGVMLVANIPIMLVFSSQAMKAYHVYMGKFKRGEMESHAAPSLEDVMEGKDVE